MDKKKILKIVFIVLFLSFIIAYVIEKSGYYEYNLRNKTVLTKESMEKFEKDVSEGRDVSIEDYVVTMLCKELLISGEDSDFIAIH
jgi:exopolysaccharide biosynthesis protein